MKKKKFITEMCKLIESAYRRGYSQGAYFSTEKGMTHAEALQFRHEIQRDRYKYVCPPPQRGFGFDKQCQEQREREIYLLIQKHLD
jgi:hypothetical protein